MSAGGTDAKPTSEPAASNSTTLGVVDRDNEIHNSSSSSIESSDSGNEKDSGAFKPSDKDTVWLVWVARDADADVDVSCSDNPCTDGTTRLFSLKSDSIATKRDILLTEYYRVADVLFDGDDDRDDDWEFDDDRSEWKLVDEDNVEERALVDLIESGDGLMHVTIVHCEVPINRSIVSNTPLDSTDASYSVSSAAPSSSPTSLDAPVGTTAIAASSSQSTSSTKSKPVKRKAISVGPSLWVAWTMACCPGEGTHDGAFEVAEHEACVKAWLADRLHEQVVHEITSLASSDVGAVYIASNPKLVDGEYHGDPATELASIQAFKRKHNLEYCPFSFGCTIASLDAHLAYAVDEDTPTQKKPK